MGRFDDGQKDQDVRIFAFRWDYLRACESEQINCDRYRSSHEDKVGARTRSRLGLDPGARMSPPKSNAGPRREFLMEAHRLSRKKQKEESVLDSTSVPLSSRAGVEYESQASSAIVEAISGQTGALDSTVADSGLPEEEEIKRALAQSMVEEEDSITKPGTGIQKGAVRFKFTAGPGKGQVRETKSFNVPWPGKERERIPMTVTEGEEINDDYEKEEEEEEEEDFDDAEEDEESKKRKAKNDTRWKEKIFGTGQMRMHSQRRNSLQYRRRIVEVREAAAKAERDRLHPPPPKVEPVRWHMPPELTCHLTSSSKNACLRRLWHFQLI